MKHEAAKLYGLMGKRKWMILAALLLAALGMQAQRVALRLAAMAKSSLPGTARHTHNDTQGLAPVSHNTPNRSNVVGICLPNVSPSPLICHKSYLKHVTFSSFAYYISRKSSCLGKRAELER